MRRKSWRYALMGGLVATAVLYGIEITSQGIAQVYGPMERIPAGGTVYEEVPEPDAAEELRPTEGKTAAAERPIEPELPPDEAFLPAAGEGGQPSVNRLAQGTAGLLQSVTDNGIRLIVSVFDAVTN